MSEWSLLSIISFILISFVLIICGMLITFFLSAYFNAKEEIQGVQKEFLAKKFLPPSVKADGSVNFTHSSSEVLGTIDGKEIFKFLKDDHDIYWIYEGIHQDPSKYVQDYDDPVVRIFIGKVIYCAVLDYEQ